MRGLTEDAITAAFMQACGPETPPRLRFVLERLTSHLHAFARETRLTHEEWRAGLDLLAWAGRITDDQRNEFVLFSDVLGLSSLVDMIGGPQGGTESSVLGPFHILGAPRIEVGGDLKGDNDGAAVFVSGVVRGLDGEPIGGAEMEIWQTADNGLYSNQDSAQSDYNLRARMVTQADGRYAFTTVRPAPYTVPDDGPAGVLLQATGRHAWRASHIHFVVQAPGWRTLVTEVFPDDDPYLERDAVFGVRDSLVVHYRRHDDPAAAPKGFALSERPGLPFHTVDFDFVLVRKET